MHFLSTLLSFSVFGLVSATSMANENGPHGQCETNFGTASQLSQTPPDKVSETDDPRKIILLSDQVEYIEEHSIKLEGNVQISQRDYTIQSDSAELNQTDDSVKLQGHIQLNGPDLAIQGDAASVDMESHQTFVSNAKFQSKSTGFSGSAKSINQEDKDTLVVQEGFFTTCPQPQPDWSFAASKIRLDNKSGFGTAEHTRFQILDVPVLYIPWFSFPIDDRRKSGFLYPSIGSANTGSGLYLSTPYYFDIAPNFDASLTPTYIHNRGFHNELEFRHLTSFFGDGELNSQLAVGYIDDDDDYLKDSLDPEADPQRWGLSFEQRFDFSASETGWHGTLDYSQVSDDDYLDDLNQGLRIDSDDYLDRNLSLNYSDQNWRFGLLIQDFEQLEADVLPEDESYQRLPELSFLLKESMGNWAFDWQSQYTYFYHDQESQTDEDLVHGSRLRHRPSLSYSQRSSWGYITPRFTLDHTDYLLEAYSPEENHLSRTVPIAELDTGLYFDRYTTWGKRGIRHSLEPRAYYVYADAKAQNEMPDFDSSIADLNFQRLFSSRRFTGGDRIADDNRLSLGVTSRWTDNSNGNDLATLSVGQIFHYDDREVGLNGEGQSQQSESLYATEFSLNPTKHLELSHSNLWSDDLNQTEESFSQVSVHSEDYRYVGNLSHRYRRDELEQVDSSVIFPVSEDVSVLGRWRYELENHRTIGTLAGLEYRSCCWRMQLLAQQYLNDDSEIDNAILFRFQLNGLGQFGEDRSKMDKQIPGYLAREKNFN